MVILPDRRSSDAAIDGPRPATSADLADVIALVDSAMRHGSDQSLLTDYPLVYALENLHNVRVLRVHGELASVVPVLPRRIRIGRAELGLGIISPTATAVHFRHQGFGSLCLASCIEAMRDADCPLSVLWTRTETFPFYERAGYHPVGSQGFTYRLSADDRAAFAPDPSVRLALLDSFDRAALEAVHTMHERDGDGIRRSPSEYPALFSLPKMRTLLAIRQGRPQGYLVASRSINKPGLIEAAGDRQAIETLIHHALAALPPDAWVEAHANRTPTLLSTVLDRRLPWRRTAEPAGMMVRINDLAPVLRAIRRLDDGRLTPPAAVTPELWAAALFGSHPLRPFTAPDGLARWLGTSLPLHIPIPVLDRS
jgi:predicted N-acetyltransferase YhbS